MGALLRSHRLLRRAVTIQALIFAAVMAFWANLVLVFEGPPYRLGPTAVGLMALIGVGGALAAPLAGRNGPAAVVSVGAALLMLAFAIFGLLPGSLVAMAAGVLVMDLAVQASQVANQARVYALNPSARRRLNTIFMATMIFGGACGAGAGGLAFSVWGWSGTSSVGAAAGGLAPLLSRRS
jgi:predicted MFS family arabinose efflux permease